MTEWISCKDKTPPQDEKILFTDGKIVECGQYDYNKVFNKYDFIVADIWVENSSLMYNITHWMPLPQPPKEIIKLNRSFICSKENIDG